MAEEAKLVGTAETPSEMLSTVESNDFASDINLFNESAPTVEELKGEESPKPEEDKTATPQPQAESEPEQQVEAKEEPKEEVKDEPKEKVKPEKPPVGFVPKEALKEERTKRQALQSEIAELKAQVEALVKEKEAPEPKQPDEFDDFKVLSQEEFENLQEEDYLEAQKYLYKLRRYDEAIKEKQAKQAQEAANKRFYTNMLQETKKAMEENIPGLFDEDDPINDNLVSFAKEHGMDDGYLYLLSNPATRIVDQDGRVYYMGNGSVGMLKMLYSLYNKTKGIEPELRKKLTEEISAEFAKKLKNGGEVYTSIGDLQTAGAEDIAPTKILSEAELSKLSPDKRKKYLGG